MFGSWNSRQKKKCIQTVPGISGVSAAWIPTKQIKVELQRQRLSWKMSLAKGDAQRVPQNVKWIQIEFSQVEFSQVGIYIKKTANVGQVLPQKDPCMVY